MKKLSIVIAVSALILGLVGCGSTPKQDPVMPVEKAKKDEIDLSENRFPHLSRIHCRKLLFSYR